MEAYSFLWVEFSIHIEEIAFYGLPAMKEGNSNAELSLRRHDKGHLFHCFSIAALGHRQ